MMVHLYKGVSVTFQNGRGTLLLYGMMAKMYKVKKAKCRIMAIVSYHLCKTVNRSRNFKQYIVVYAFESHDYLWKGKQDTGNNSFLGGVGVSLTRQMKRGQEKEDSSPSMYLLSFVSCVRYPFYIAVGNTALNQCKLMNDAPLNPKSNHAFIPQKC